MWIKELKIYNFRRFESRKIEFNEGVNLITGLNAVGKTTVLESVYYLGVCKSFKTHTENELINQKYAEMSVVGAVIGDKSTYKLKVCKEKKGKSVFVNDNKLKKISDFLGKMLVVSFSNDDIVRMISSSRERRYLFEPIICQISKDYVGASIYYKKLLNDRNALLKRLECENAETLLKTLETVNDQMVVYGTKIIDIRKRFVEKVNEITESIHSKITSNRERIEIKYSPNVSKEMFRKMLSENLTEEIKKGASLYGPHKDDYTFFVDGLNVVDFGSQGQQRSCMISFKIACAKIIKMVKNENPVLLLDDVFSELDHVRQNKLFDAFDEKMQVLISSPVIKELSESVINKIKIIKLE